MQIGNDVKCVRNKAFRTFQMTFSRNNDIILAYIEDNHEW